MKKNFLHFLPFWFFLVFYKFGGGLHFAMLSTLGEKVLPLWSVGLFIGGGSLIQLIFDVPAGHLLDRFGYLRLLRITTAIFLLAGIALLFQLSLIVFVISLLFATFGWIFFGPGVSAYVLSMAPKKNAGAFISFRDIFGSLGIVLTSAVLGFVLQHDTRILGWIVTVSMSLGLVALWLVPQDTVSVHAQIKIPTHHYYIRRHYLHRVIHILGKLNPASFMLLLLGFAESTFYGVIWFVVPLVISQQAGIGLFSFGLGVFDFAIVFLGFLLGKIADRGNKRTLVFFGLLSFAVFGLLLGFHFNWLFLVFGFLATTGHETASLSLWSWLHSLDREHAHDGLVAGVITLFEDLGWAVGPVIAGLLYEPLGPSWTIACGAGCILATWIAYHFFVGSHHSTSVGHVPKKPQRSRLRV